MLRTNFVFTPSGMERPPGLAQQAPYVLEEVKVRVHPQDRLLQLRLDLGTLRPRDHIGLVNQTALNG